MAKKLGTPTNGPGDTPEAPRTIILPSLSHLQFAALDAIICGEQSGQQIRHLLGWNKTLPAFYHMMAKLERLGLVKSRYQKVYPVDGHAYIECHACYQITREGLAAWQLTMEFYLARLEVYSALVQGQDNA